jgi:outer membrane protein assembly factor BamB
MAYNPDTGLVYLPTQNTSNYYERLSAPYQQGQWNTGTSIRGGGTRPLPPRPALGAAGVLKAWDPAGNREVWRFETAGQNGGTLSTGGNLVFWGTVSRMVALDARSGEALWEADVGQPTATPITYELDGRQYVTILSGSSPPQVLTFALDARQ